MLGGLPAPSEAQAIAAIQIALIRAGAIVPGQDVETVDIAELLDRRKHEKHPYVLAGIDLLIARAFPLEDAIQASQDRLRLELLEDPAAEGRARDAIKEIHSIATTAMLETKSGRVEPDSRARLAAAKELVKFYVSSSRSPAKRTKQEAAKDAGKKHNDMLRRVEQIEANNGAVETPSGSDRPEVQGA